MKKPILVFVIILGLLAVFSRGASADYYSSGTLTSTNLLSGLDVASVDSFWYNADVPAGTTTLKVQFKNTGGWYSSAGALDEWDTLSDTSGGDAEIDLSGLSWSTADFYYRMEFGSTDGTVTLTLESVRVDYTPPVPPYTPEKTMVANPGGSGGGVVSAQDISFPDPDTDPGAISARSWVVTGYNNVDFPTYSALQTMYGYDDPTTTTITDLSSISAPGGTYKIVNSYEIELADGAPCDLVADAVIFVNGSLTISRNFHDSVVSGDPLASKNNCNSSLAFIVSGNISIDGGVKNIYGIFYAGGMIDTVTDGTTDSNPLYIFGSLLARGSPTAFHLDRNLGAGNATSPAEQIIYMPQYFITLKDLLGRSQVSWKEVR